MKKRSKQVKEAEKVLAVLGRAGLEASKAGEELKVILNSYKLPKKKWWQFWK